MGDNDRFVLFIDVLGFADLVEQHESMLEDDLKTHTYEQRFRRGALSTPLSVCFKQFHDVVETRLRETKAYPHPTSVVFSDSAFVVIHFLKDIFEFAPGLMRSLIEALVPARMGVGCGSWVASRFNTDVQQGHTIHASQFYGTGIVRAHKAESCGIPGLRILVHPSVDRKIEEVRSDTRGYKPPPPESTMTLLSSAPRYNVVTELNYLSEQSNPILYNLICGMMAEAPQEHQHHYAETLAAIERMREKLRLPMILQPYGPSSG